MIELALIKQHLRVLHNREDDVYDMYKSAALTMFEEFTERTLYATQEDLDSDPSAPANAVVLTPAITQGVLLLIGYFDKTRDMDATIPRATMSLWQPYRAYA